MKRILSFLVVISCFFVISADRAFADRKIRIHFVGASFTFAKDEAQNSKFSAVSSSAGYDAVWEASVPSGFPTGFGAAKRATGSGSIHFRDKIQQFDCDADFSFANESRWPSVSVYNISGDKYAIQIVAPHEALLSSNTASPCAEPSFVHYADGEGVNSTPPYSGLPNFPGSSSPPENYSFAAFVVDADKPETTVNFSYTQTASFPQLLYQSKSVWFGYVNVELNPNKQLPGATDPLKLYDYSPPPQFTAPSDPPVPTGNPSNGGDTGPTIPIIKDFLREPIIKDITDTLKLFQQLWSLGVGARSLTTRVSPRLYTDPNGAFEFDITTRKLTLHSISGAPGAGTLAIKLGVGDAQLKSVAKGISVSGSGSQDLVLTLPPALIKAFDKGKKIPMKIEASFNSTEGKKNKATVTKSFTIKKR